MVEDSRTSPRPDHLRPLNPPRPVQVVSRNGHPVGITVGGRQRRVLEVQDVWRVEDEWWRDTPIRRHYYQVLLDGGSILVLYHDDIAGEWRTQSY